MTLDFLIGDIAVLSLIISIMSWATFIITTMRKLDKAVVSAGMPRPCQWDPIWMRCFFYTWPIIFSGKSFSKLENQIIDTNVVNKNVNAFDQCLAWILFASTWIMIITLFTGDLLFA